MTYRTAGSLREVSGSSMFIKWRRNEQSQESSSFEFEQNPCLHYKED